MTRELFLRLITVAAAIAMSSPVLAMQLTLPGEPEVDDPTPPCEHAMPTDGPLAIGRVVEVDRAGGKITLEYRPIPQLFPEGGTRIFQVEDAASLKGLGPGDRVRFEVERDGRSYVVTRIENSN